MSPCWPARTTSGCTQCASFCSRRRAPIARRCDPRAVAVHMPARLSTAVPARSARVGDQADDAGMSRSAESHEDNQVFLRGRLAVLPAMRTLPSGDALAVFRLTVTRPPTERTRVDSIECASVRTRVHRTLAKAHLGDELELEGSLRRRFWRTPSGPASRYAVEVEAARLIRAGRRGGASADRMPASG